MTNLNQANLKTVFEVSDFFIAATGRDDFVTHLKL
jgi:hypothetical protein